MARQYGDACSLKESTSVKLGEEDLTDLVEDGDVIGWTVASLVSEVDEVGMNGEEEDGGCVARDGSEGSEGSPDRELEL